MKILDGCIALVTGAGRGIGAAISRRYAREGATVIVADLDEANARAVADEVRSLGAEAEALAVDVRETAQSAAMIDYVVDRFGRIDILVNNAGIARQEFLVDMSEDDWDAVIDTNLKGVFLVAQQAARSMIKAEKPGSIINIASILGLRVSKALGSYIAAKSAVVQTTKAMALEWAQFGIRVNAIAPGYFVTEMNQEQFDQGAAEILKKRIPLARIGEVEELSGPILLLASSAGSFMTGSVIAVDGGQLCNSL